MMGPIVVRATGPKTFTIVDPTVLENHKQIKRDQVFNLIPPEPTKSTTKRPSLHFEPVRKSSRPVILPDFVTKKPSIIVTTPKLNNVWEDIEVNYDNRRWPRSKARPTARSDIDPRHSSLNVRFEEKHLDDMESSRSTYVRFPS